MNKKFQNIKLNLMNKKNNQNNQQKHYKNKIIKC